MLRRRTNRDVRYLLLTALAITGGYAACARFQPLPSGHGWGLALGIVGMLLMMGAQTFYTWRKTAHSPSAWGTLLLAACTYCDGIVGGDLRIVAWRGAFYRDCGVAAAMSAVILISGLVGRYLYTALDRNTDDWQLNHQALQRRVHDLSQSLGSRLGSLAELVRELDKMATPPTGWRLFVTRAWAPWRAKRLLQARLARQTDCPATLRREFK